MATRSIVVEKEFLAAPAPRSLGRVAGVRKVALVLAAALGLLLAAEAALQVRSHFRLGESVLNLILAESRYVEDAETGLLLLRPGRVFPSSRFTLRSNSLGLRSPEIALARTPGSWRLAVVGASTVMGAHAVDNDQTFPARLEQRLRRDFPDRQIEVVNAGIVGYDLAAQKRMLETRVAALRPDLVILYPGFNDFVGYCRDAGGQGPERQGLPLVAMPEWFMSLDFIQKNTVSLRTPPVRQTSMRDPDALDLKPYRGRLEALASRAAELGLPLLIATNARAYRRDQPVALQEQLSETARYYNHCFDLEGLHVLYDRHNAEIRTLAESRRLPLIPLDETVPGGPRYFADAQHFSAEGEVLVANALADFLVSKRLLPD